jgi:hypothetical protein
MPQHLGEIKSSHPETKELCTCGHAADVHADGEWECSAIEFYGKNDYAVKCECAFFFPINI